MKLRNIISLIGFVYFFSSANATMINTDWSLETTEKLLEDVDLIARASFQVKEVKKIRTGKFGTTFKISYYIRPDKIYKNRTDVKLGDKLLYGYTTLIRDYDKKKGPPLIPANESYYLLLKKPLKSNSWDIKRAGFRKSLSKKMHHALKRYLEKHGIKGSLDTE